MSDMDVLLVEDDRSLATVMEEALIASGHCVQVARSVPEAYDTLVRAHRFQAILLDLRLGTERGEAIFLRLRALRVSYPPVIILSAQPHAEIAEMARLIGAAKWLTKPASMAAVNAALVQVLRDIH